MKTTLFLLLLCVTAHAQLPDLGTKTDEIFRMAKSQNAEIDSIMFDEKNIEGNRIVQSYTIAPIMLGGFKGVYQVGFDRKGSSILNSWQYGDILEGSGQAVNVASGVDGMLTQKITITDVKKIRDSLEKKFGKPISQFEGDEIITYIWSKNPPNTLTMKEGNIHYLHFN